MDADEALKLVEFADNLVFEKTGNHLKDIEQEVLQQVLEGKLLKQVRCETHSNGYIQKFIARDLWKLLSQVTAKKVGKKNVQQVLEKLHDQRSRSATHQQSESLKNLQIELNGHVTFNGSVSYPKSSTESTPTETPNEPTTSQSEESDRINLNAPNRQDPNHSYSDEMSITSLLIDRQWHEAEASESNNSEPNSESPPFALLNFIQFIKPGIPLLLSMGVLGSSFALSWLANWYGVTNHLTGQLFKAQLGYNVALKLNPLSTAAHYSQGVLYEDQQNYEKAHAKYQLAIEGGLIEAYNNQARLYILQTKEYDAAVSLLNTGLPLAKDNRVKADLYKNRGWARLEQGRYAEAKVDLQEAIQLKSDRAPAYCLLAQVLEREGDNKRAMAQWENCLGYAQQTNLPEEDNWYHLAQQRLDAQGRHER